MSEEKLKELSERYQRLAHAMQSGVKMVMNWEDGPQPDNIEESSTSPKHLRTGINAAMSDAGGLVRLLIDKGIITQEDYLTAICEAMEDVVKRYEEQIKKHFGGNPDFKVNLR